LRRNEISGNTARFYLSFWVKFSYDPKASHKAPTIELDAADIPTDRIKPDAVSGINAAPLVMTVMAAERKKARTPAPHLMHRLTPLWPPVDYFPKHPNTPNPPKILCFFS